MNVINVFNHANRHIVTTTSIKKGIQYLIDNEYIDCNTKFFDIYSRYENWIYGEWKPVKDILGYCSWEDEIVNQSPDFFYQVFTFEESKLIE